LARLHDASRRRTRPVTFGPLGDALTAGLVGDFDEAFGRLSDRVGLSAQERLDLLSAQPPHHSSPRSTMASDRPVAARAARRAD